MLLKKKFADDFPFSLQECLEDTLSPVVIKLNFTQADSENANAVLNVDSKKHAVVEVCTVTTEKGCGQMNLHLNRFSVNMSPTQFLRYFYIERKIHLFQSSMCSLQHFSVLFRVFKCDINSFIQVPFEKQCRKSDSCIAELVVDFDFLYVYLAKQHSSCKINII